MMLARLAWRNTWRNPVRSGVVICALALGIWAGLFVSAFVNGMMRQKINSVIDLEISNLQVHAPGFRDDYLVSRVIAGSDTLLAQLEKEPEVQAISSRTVGYVMLATAHASGGIRLSGLDPGEESRVTQLDKKVKEGTYFPPKKNQLLISGETAKKYDAGVGSRVVLTFQDKEGEITSAAFRVCGIYKTGNTMYDAANIFCRREDVQALAGIGRGIHEMAVRLHHHEATETLVKKYQGLYPRLEILSWMDLSPGMRYMIGVISLYTVIIAGIVLLALLFSIINTMLMAVLDRTRELGMLMVVGMSRKRVFSMIILETLFLSVAGGPAGLLLAWITVAWTGRSGIDLGSAAYGDLGFSNLIHPVLATPEYVKVTAMVLIMTLLAALYPARKALSLNPAEAIRKI